MKAFILSAMATMVAVSASASVCASRSAGSLAPKTDYSRLLDGSKSSSSRPQAIQPSSTARGADGGKSRRN